MASPLARWPPVSFGGPVRARNPGGVRTKGREKLRVASPPSCLPRPLPSSPAPSSFKPRLARVVSVQPRPPPSEEMAEEPEPQVKGARPPPAPGPRGRPASPLGRPPEPALESPVLVVSPPFPDGRPARPPIPTPVHFSRAPPPHPARRCRASPRRVQCSTTTLTLGNKSRWLEGGGVPLPRVWSQGMAGGSPGAASVGAWGAVPEKLGGSAGQVSRLADSVAGKGGGGGRSKLETAKTMRPNRRPPQTMAGTVHTGRAEGEPIGAGGGAWPGRGPRCAPHEPPGRPHIRPGSPGGLPISEQAVNGRCVSWICD